MIGTSALEYGFIRICIFGLSSVAPLSLLYCAAAFTCVPRRWRLPITIELWLAAETLFWTGFSLLYRRYLQRPATHPRCRSREERRKLVSRVTADVEDAERYICAWFKGARIDEIGFEDVKTYLAWAFFNRERVPGEDEEELEEYAREMERMMGQRFRPGRRLATPLRTTLDPVDMLHRSLLWYLCVGVVDFLTYLKLQHAGFHFHRLPLASFFGLFPFRPVSLVTSYRAPTQHLTYWHRPHTSTTRLPIVFIHGIGIGLYPYTSFLDELNADAHVDGQVGILAIEIMPISFRITHAALDKDDMCAELHQIVAAHGYDRFVLVSHSYGSVVTTHILASATLRPMVASALLIDPVSFLLHMPDVAYNFTIRKPQHANEWQLWYFASKDPGVAHTLGRRFFWSENVMWREDAEDFVRDGGRMTRFSQAKETAIQRIDTKESEGRTTEHKDAWKHQQWRGDGLEILWFDDVDHAQVFDTKTRRARLIKAALKYCDIA